jgi:hypothetical protein
MFAEGPSGRRACGISSYFSFVDLSGVLHGYSNIPCYQDNNIIYLFTISLFLSSEFSLSLAYFLVSVSMSHVRGFWKLSGDPWFSLHIYF